MLLKALKVPVNNRSKENRVKMRCLSLWFQSTRTSNLCALVGSKPGKKKLLATSVVAESHVLGLGKLHLGKCDRKFNAMGLGLGILLPGNGCRRPPMSGL